MTRYEREACIVLRAEGCSPFLPRGSQGETYLDVTERLREAFDPLAEAHWMSGANARPSRQPGQHFYPARPAEMNGHRAYDALGMDAFYGPNRGAR